MNRLKKLFEDQLKNLSWRVLTLLRLCKWSSIENLFKVVRCFPKISYQWMPAKGVAPWITRQDSTDEVLIAPSQEIPTFPLPRKIFRQSHFDQADGQPYPIFGKRLGKTRLVGRNLEPINESYLLAEESLSCHYPLGVRKHTNLTDFTIESVQSLKGSYTSILGVWTQCANYYHWFLDVLPRFIVIFKFPEYVKILIPEGLATFQKDSLMLLGVWHRCEPVSTQHLEVEDFWFASYAGTTNCMNPMAIDFLRSKVMGAIESAEDKPNYEKIFFSRQGAIRFGEAGMKIEEFFQSQGFQLIEASQYTLAEQVTLTQNASLIAGIHGAALTNLLWANPHAKVIEIFGEHWLRPTKENIAIALGLDYHSVVFPSYLDGEIKTFDQGALEQLLRS